MITFKKYFNWEKNYTNDLYSIVIFYNSKTKISMPKEYRPRIDFSVRKNKIIKLLSSIMKEENNYVIRLRDTKLTWQPKFLKNRRIDFIRNSYLEKQNWEKRKYSGNFITRNIRQFLELFINFPFEYSYQDILILNKNINLLIVLSYHGTIWIVSEDKEYLKNISYLFEIIGAVVVPSNNMLLNSKS